MESNYDVPENRGANELSDHYYAVQSIFVEKMKAEDRRGTKYLYPGDVLLSPPVPNSIMPPPFSSFSPFLQNPHKYRRHRLTPNVVP